VRPRLLHAEHDPALDEAAPLEGRRLEHDLELEALFDAMARGDRTIAAVAPRILLDPLRDREAIRARQRMLRSCLEHPDVVRSLYAISVRTLERRKKMYWGLVRRPDAVVHHGIELVNLYAKAFRELRGVADSHAERVGPGGLGTFLAMARRELDEAFLAELDGHLKALRFQAGVRVSARLGGGNAGTGYVLERPALARPSALHGLVRWWRSLRASEPTAYTYRLNAHDDSGVRALADLQARGLARTASAVAAACDDLLWFFRQLRGELAFYVGCLNLHDRLAAQDSPVCFPEPRDAAEGARTASGLYDVNLALTVGRGVVGNDLTADGAHLIVITGANQGGKTTFLRSLGTAQLMMQAGMFVSARSFRSSITPGLFTHFTREEDVAMRSGRLDEELARLDEIVSALTPGATLLLNESFASTNEREGSELAEGIVRALTESGVRIVFVTHLSEFARAAYERRSSGTLFLRAERRPDGTRTFRMPEGAPLRTSHGADLYRSVFGAAPGAGADGATARPGAGPAAPPTPSPGRTAEPARGD
jgi:hypothetical protein